MRETVRTRVLLGLLLGSLLVAGAGAAPASGYEGVSVKHARQHVRTAQRDLARAQARLREARATLDATRTYSRAYGVVVGRWTWLARDVGWPRDTLGTLMFVIDRESGGYPGIMNSQGSGAAGLLQLMPGWYTGQWGLPAGDPRDPRYNLHSGYLMWKTERWRPWGM